MTSIIRDQMYTLSQLSYENAGWFDEVCAGIAQGDSLDQAYAKVSHSINVPWPVLRMWFKVNERMEARYQDALAARLEYRRERAAANVTKIATVEHDREKVSVGDTLKAADMVLGATKGTGISVGVGSGSSKVKIEVEFVGAGGS